MLFCKKVIRHKEFPDITYSNYLRFSKQLGITKIFELILEPRIPGTNIGKPRNLKKSSNLDSQNQYSQILDRLNNKC